MKSQSNSLWTSEWHSSRNLTFDYQWNYIYIYDKFNQLISSNGILYDMFNEILDEFWLYILIDFLLNWSMPPFAYLFLAEQIRTVRAGRFCRLALPAPLPLNLAHVLFQIWPPRVMHSVCKFAPHTPLLPRFPSLRLNLTTGISPLLFFFKVNLLSDLPHR